MTSREAIYNSSDRFILDHDDLINDDGCRLLLLHNVLFMHSGRDRRVASEEPVVVWGESPWVVGATSSTWTAPSSAVVVTVVMDVSQEEAWLSISGDDRCAPAGGSQQYLLFERIVAIQ